MEMTRRDDLLGSTMLLWSGAALLALYLLCNPTAATLQEPFDPTRLWGAVLGLVFLGAALPAHGLLPWLLFLGTLPLLLLPTPLNRRLGPAAFLGTSALGALLLAGRCLHRRKGARPVPGRAKRVARRKRKGAASRLLRRPGHFRPRPRTERDLEMPQEEVKEGE